MRKLKQKIKKTSLGSRILNHVPWRTALTVAAFAIPVAGPILGTIIGALAYGNYRHNSRAENPASNEPDKSNNEQSRKDSAQPGRLKKSLFRVGAVAIGFLLGGPIGAIIAGGLVAIDAVSNGKLIQGAEKVLDAGYDALSWTKDKMLDAGKWAVDKVRNSERGGKEKKDELVQGFDNPCYSPDVELETAEMRNVEQESPASEKESDSRTIIAGKKVEGEKSRNVLEERENSANQGPTIRG